MTPDPRIDPATEAWARMAFDAYAHTGRGQRWDTVPAAERARLIARNRAEVVAILAVADEHDPLRAALRGPSDELIDRLSEVMRQHVIDGGTTGADDPARLVALRAALRALAEEFGTGEPR